MTSRELADAIDELICLRVKQGQSFVEDFPSTDEKTEVVIRAIADALKRLDHNGGLYVVGKDACGKEQV